MTREVLVDGYTLFVRSDDSGAADGVYHRDVRHLSTLSVSVEGADLTRLGADLAGPARRRVVATDAGSTVNRVDEPDQQKRADLVLAVDQAVRERAGLFQRVRATNHAPTSRSVALVVEFDADFADMFEVRGLTAPEERDVATDVGDRRVRFAHTYEDAGGSPRTRATAVGFDRSPAVLASDRARFDLDLGVQATETIGMQVRPSTRAGASGEGIDAGDLDSSGVPARKQVLDVPAIETGREAFDGVFEQARRDLDALATETEAGPVALAGVPWFATVFGRDSLITAHQALPVDPSLARGTLRYLAARRGTTVDEAREEAPGKVFHEERNGELADRGAIPHTPYYGSVDATPLWITLLGECWRWTAEDALVRELSGALADALDWIESAREAVGNDPFLYYDESPGMGLSHKAWRDTPGSVQFPDGTIATHPIASVEVQGYVYRAFRDAATLYERVLGDPARAATCRDAADRLADAFESAFWVPDRGYYAVAKDGDGATVPTPTSNVGHCLWAGIVPEERIDPVARTLHSGELFSGWGVRTMGPSAAGYSPASYHLGSVWPHDTAFAVHGLARYGRYGAVEDLAGGLLAACTRFSERRIPEVFCGFDDDLAPKTYPASCVPQAWSSGAPYVLLRALFGFEPREDGPPETAHEPDVLDADAIDPIHGRWKE